MICFRERAWSDYLYWRQTDRKILKRINALIRDIQRAPATGIGKPEALKHDLSLGRAGARSPKYHQSRPRLRSCATLPA